MPRGPALLPPDGRPVVLASASPRRRHLLAQIGLVPDLVDPAALDESVRAREIPRDYAARMAEGKAIAVLGRHPGSHILAADTVVACGRRILPKAASEADARLCLDLLSGRRHRVIGAIAMMTPDGSKTTRLVSTIVAFKRFEKTEIDVYLASGEWQGKAGGYAIQGLAAAFVLALNGSYTNVVGLPLAQTYGLLRGAGFAHARVGGNG